MLLVLVFAPLPLIVWQGSSLFSLFSFFPLTHHLLFGFTLNSLLFHDTFFVKFSRCFGPFPGFFQTVGRNGVDLADCIAYNLLWAVSTVDRH